MLKWHGIIYIKCKIKYYNIAMIIIFYVIVWFKIKSYLVSHFLFTVISNYCIVVQRC